MNTHFRKSIQSTRSSHSQIYPDNYIQYVALSNGHPSANHQIPRCLAMLILQKTVCERDYAVHGF